MGFFNKKKNSETPASVLSETEIQKKLYGEFSTGGPHTVIGERDPFKEPASSRVSLPESSPETEDAGLFSAPREAPIEPDLSPRHTSSETKPLDSAPRYVPFHNFEKPSASPAPASSGSDPYARFRYNRPQESNLAALLGLWKAFPMRVGELFQAFLDPKHVAVRRFFYWGVAVFVVFLLFLGVNVLNTQREEAMRTRYKIPREMAAVSVPVPVSESGAVAGEPVAERPVVITPAPPRVKKTRPSDESISSKASANISYVIQVVTYPTRQDAERIVTDFKRAGLHAFVKENVRPSGRVFYLVLLGGFRTEAEAQALLLKFRKMEVARPFQDAFVKSSRS